MDLQILKAEQERQGKLIDDLVKAMDIQNRQEKLIDDLVKATDIQSLKAEIEELKKDGLDKESNIQLLRTELEEQKEDGVDKESKVRYLTTEVDRLEKLVGELNKKFDNQSLRTEQKSQGKLIEERVEESSEHNLEPVPLNCTDAKSSGINEILIPKFSSQPFKVACDAETRGGGWTIILRRMDGSVDFYRNWAAYKEGFGDLNGEFFLGFDKIHALTEERNQELLVVLEDNEGKEAFEMYDSFAIGNEDQQYVLHTLGNATGSAGDSLSKHRGMKFTTKDRDNDSQKNRNCAVSFTGAWWYYDCFQSNLAGKYDVEGWEYGVYWSTYSVRGKSLKTAVMMIRPKK
ncbi:ficolin-1-like [Drosophila innubila]|uniref:ficolin-1-like n=1 Tax=Drosophila innubila TaxID=198719 RepID=UPI00148CF806|nr:ficolin-1-like [Drosophila innubila]